MGAILKEYLVQNCLVALLPRYQGFCNSDDKDQEVIIYNPIIEPRQIFLLDRLELGNLEIGNISIYIYISFKIKYCKSDWS